MDQQISAFEITCRNAALLKEFYSGMFGWTISEPDSEGLSTIECGGSIGGRLFQPPENVPSSLITFIQVESVQGSLRNAETLGGGILFGPLEEADGSTIGMFTDPEGIMIGLRQVPKQER